MQENIIIKLWRKCVFWWKPTNSNCLFFKYFWDNISFFWRKWYKR